jgi:hypothetical protein
MGTAPYPQVFLLQVSRVLPFGVGACTAEDENLPFP